jgi:predicted  nucleic acid-binding Zn ribbon protein
MWASAPTNQIKQRDQYDPAVFKNRAGACSHREGYIKGSVTVFYRIELIPKAELPEDVTDLLWDYWGRLYRSGQILKDYVFVKNQYYTLMVTTPKDDSLDPKYDTIYVQETRKKVETLFELRMIPMGENLNSCRYCSCESHTAIDMVTYDGDIDSPFMCCDCGRPIALYEIPFVDHGEHCDVVFWKKDFSSMDWLWMSCLSDRFTGNQLVNPKSALNEQGREIAQFLTKQLEIPVYYNMFDSRRKTVKRVNVGDRMCRVCPICGETMRFAQFSGQYDIDVCDGCGLSSD